MECYQDDARDDEQEELEEQTIIKNVHEALQVGFHCQHFHLVIPIITRYISGVNEQTEEIEMTVPVLTQMTLQEDNMINKQMCFYLNKKHQENPPTPVDEDVKIEQNEEMTVFVHTFGG